jgi:DNA-binding transcriptional MocR family regulator
LAVDLTTVTRAYGEARRRGLTEARVGQGTFVAESRARAPRAVAAGIEFDLSMNLPPEPLEADLEGRIVRGFDRLRRDYGITDFLNYQHAGGSERDRGIAAVGRHHLVAETARHRFEQAALHGIVVDDENCLSHVCAKSNRSR